VNGVQYNTTQQFIYNNGTSVTVQAISPAIIGFTRYVFVNWSDNGDTTHTITMNNNITLTAFYKAQYRLAINSVPGNTYGGNDFFDSASTRTFGVLSRDVFFNGAWHQFKDGQDRQRLIYNPDTTGNDTAVTLTLNNAILRLQTGRTRNQIKQIGTEILKYSACIKIINPFNLNTTINFDIPKSTDVKL
jgi:hypothetical protein